MTWLCDGPFGPQLQLKRRYAGTDASPVHSPDGGATLAARFPRATRRLLPDEGGAILWTQARAILADCVDDPAARPAAPMR